MAESRAGLVFHPVRMRVLQALLRGGRLTPGELGERLRDVPPATLYRHLKRLADGGVIEVVEERPVRGVVERVYAVNTRGAAWFGAAEMAGVARDDHARFFAVFLAELLGEFERYLERPTVDLAADGVGYRQFPLWLSDAELRDLLESMNLRIEAAMQNEPGPGRRLRVLTRIVMPADRTDGDTTDE